MPRKMVMSSEHFDYITTEDGGVEARVSMDPSGREFYGCEVCWTCRWFDGISKCIHVIPREIKVSPAWFRCRIYLNQEYVEKLLREDAKRKRR